MTNDEANYLIERLKVLCADMTELLNQATEELGRIEQANSPQTFDKPPKCLGCVYSELDKVFHPCASCVDFSKYVGEVSADTPQTEKPTAQEYEKWLFKEPQPDCPWK